jgi:hypothetical protein
MKLGMRTPSVKKSIKARTTGKIKRQVKKSVVPMYGKKGTGIIKNPEKAVYNKVYNKTTFSVVPPLLGRTSSTTKTKPSANNRIQQISSTTLSNKVPRRYTVVFAKWEKSLLSYITISFILGLLFPPLLLLCVVFACIFTYKEFGKKEVLILDNFTGDKKNIPREEYRLHEKEYKDQRRQYSKIPLSEQLNSYDLFIQQAKESSKIIDTTTNPETFFSRYDFILDRTDKLLELIRDPRLKSDGSDFTNLKQKLIETRAETTDEFIERLKISTATGLDTLKTDRGKENRIKKAQEQILLFSEYLSEEQKNYILNWNLTNVSK